MKHQRYRKRLTCISFTCNNGYAPGTIERFKSKKLGGSWLFLCFFLFIFFTFLVVPYTHAGIHTHLHDDMKDGYIFSPNPPT